MAASKPEDLFVRHPMVVRSAEKAGPDSRLLTGERGSADADISAIKLPSHQSQHLPAQDYAWTPNSIQDYVNSQIANRINNFDDPSVNVPGISEWMDFLTWPKEKWARATQGLSYPGGVNPFDRDRLYNTDPGHPERWGDAFLGIRLPVSKGPLTWDDVLHIRNALKSDETGPILRYRPGTGQGGRRRRKSRKAKKSAHKSRKHRKPKKNTRRRRAKHRRTRR